MNDNRASKRKEWTWENQNSAMIVDSLDEAPEDCGIDVCIITQELIDALKAGKVVCFATGSGGAEYTAALVWEDNPNE